MWVVSLKLSRITPGERRLSGWVGHRAAFLCICYSTHAKYHAHLILLDLITATLLLENYRLWSFSLCNFLNSGVVISLKCKYFHHHFVLKHCERQSICSPPEVTDRTIVLSSCDQCINLAGGKLRIPWQSDYQVLHPQCLFPGKTCLLYFMFTSNRYMTHNSLLCCSVGIRTPHLAKEADCDVTDSHI
jgi:hypothetical protein